MSSTDTNGAKHDLEDGPSTTKKHKSDGIRTGDKDNEEVVIPKNRIIIVFVGLMLTVFLAALDQTIVCISPCEWLSDISNRVADYCSRIKWW